MPRQHFFEKIALKTAGQVEGEFWLALLANYLASFSWLDKSAGLAGFLARLAQPHLCDTYS